MTQTSNNYLSEDVTNSPMFISNNLANNPNVPTAHNLGVDTSNIESSVSTSLKSSTNTVWDTEINPHRPSRKRIIKITLNVKPAKTKKVPNYPFNYDE